MLRKEGNTVFPTDRESPVCQIHIIKDRGLQEFGVDDDEWGKLVEDENSDGEFGEYFWP